MPEFVPSRGSDGASGAFEHIRARSRSPRRSADTSHLRTPRATTQRTYVNTNIRKLNAHSPPQVHMQ